MSTWKKPKNPPQNSVQEPSPPSRNESSSVEPPPTSVYRDQETYLQARRWNEAIFNSAVRPGVPESQQVWSPYRHLFFNGRPTPIFYDYRQMFAGVTTAGSARFFAGAPYQPTAGSARFFGGVPYQPTRTTAPSMRSGAVQQSNGQERETRRNSLELDLEVTTSVSVRTSVEEEVKLAKEIARCDILPCEIGGLQRRWTTLKKQKKPAGQSGSSLANSGAKFTVCSYNVLCQSTLLETAHLYTHCSTKYLAWNYRWQLLRKEFSILNADVFCLQEVEEEYYESHYLKFFQSRGYDGLHKRRMGVKLDGCAIFWRRDRFDLSFSDSMHFQVANSILDRDNVALIVVLALKPSSPGGSKRQAETNSSTSRIVVANTHLLFNPGRGDIKLCQVAMLLARLQKISRTSNNADSMIICGDFNSVPFSPLYNFLMEGRLHYIGLCRAEVSGQLKRGGPPLKYPLLPAGANIDENTCQENSPELDEDVIIDEPGCLAHNVKLLSAYSHRCLNGKPEVSTHHSKDSANVDYIFYNVNSKTVVRQEADRATTSRDGGKVELLTTDVEEGRLRCRSILCLPTSEQIKQSVGWLPNQYCASDHLPLAAEFEVV